MSGVEFRQLVSFDAVVRCGGFTRAAEDLHLAQPAISAQVKRLESELGVALLARTTRRVALTEAGEQFLARTRRILAEVAGARDDAMLLADVARGSVTIGTAGVVGGFDLPGALARFARRHPGVSLSLRAGLVDALTADLRTGSLDLVLGPIHPGLPADVVVAPLARDRLVLATAPGVPGGPLSRFADEAFVCLPTGSGLRDVLDGLAADLDVRLPVRFEASTVDGVRDLVAAGLGVALLTASVLERPGPAVDVHDLVPATAHPPIGLLHRAPLSPAARALRSALVEEAGPAADAEVAEVPDVAESSPPRP